MFPIKFCDQSSNLAPYKNCSSAGEFENTEPDAFDLFRLCHFSNKKQGYTPNVQLAIVSQLSYGVLSIC